MKDLDCCSLFFQFFELLINSLICRKEDEADVFPFKVRCPSTTLVLSEEISLVDEKDVTFSRVNFLDVFFNINTTEQKRVSSIDNLHHQMRTFQDAPELWRQTSKLRSNGVRRNPSSSCRLISQKIYIMNSYCRHGFIVILIVCKHPTLPDLDARLRKHHARPCVIPLRSSIYPTLVYSDYKQV